MAIQKKMPWDFTEEGKANIIDCLEKKFANAQLDLENKKAESLRKNTIINIDEYELTLLMFALDTYKLSRKRYAKNKTSENWKTLKSGWKEDHNKKKEKTDD